MSTRADRKKRRQRQIRLMSCPKCLKFKAQHYDPWTKTYSCTPSRGRAKSDAAKVIT